MSSPTHMLRTRTYQYSFGLLFVLALCLLSLIPAGAVRAQDASATAEAETAQTAPPRRPIPFVNKVRTEAQNIRQNVIEKRGEIRDMRKDTRASTTEARKETRGEMRDNRPAMASTTRRVQRELQEGKRLLASSTREARKDDRRETLLSEMAKRAQMKFDLIVRRLSTAIDRLDNISGRIDTRIAKLKTDGIDTSIMESLHATAKTKVNTANTAVKAIVMPTLPSTAENTTPQAINDLLKSTRTEVKAAEDAIKEAQRALNAVVVEMKNKGKEKAEKETASEDTE